MLPYVTILGYSVPAYGLMAVLGFLAGLALVLLGSRRFGLSREDGVYLYVVSCLGGLLGDLQALFDSMVRYYLAAGGQLFFDIPHSIAVNNYMVVDLKYSP